MRGNRAGELLIPELPPTSVETDADADHEEDLLLPQETEGSQPIHTHYRISPPRGTVTQCRCSAALRWRAGRIRRCGHRPTVMRQRIGSIFDC